MTLCGEFRGSCMWTNRGALFVSGSKYSTSERCGSRKHSIRNNCDPPYFTFQKYINRFNLGISSLSFESQLQAFFRNKLSATNHKPSRTYRPSNTTWPQHRARDASAWPDTSRFPRPTSRSDSAPGRCCRKRRPWSSKKEVCLACVVTCGRRKYLSEVLARQRSCLFAVRDSGRWKHLLRFDGGNWNFKIVAVNKKAPAHWRGVGGVGNICQQKQEIKPGAYSQPLVSSARKRFTLWNRLSYE